MFKFLSRVMDIIAGFSLGGLCVLKVAVPDAISNWLICLAASGVLFAILSASLEFVADLLAKKADRLEKTRSQT